MERVDSGGGRRECENDEGCGWAVEEATQRPLDSFAE